ncbi:MAG: penicillin-binding protein 2 [Verrucomicrobia bacterium]|nr:MAG: penicillin-binding protein 2 [Verrucomicrobiota bacterium]PYL47617.1 MAG: penicillin-binding protein 2 [Verrucomicrobiota bacterium]
MNRLRISPILRLQFLGLLMLLGLGALAARLWWVQVARGAAWTARIRGSSAATVRIPSIRGEIRDRTGLPLVQNRASYEVDFYLPEMVKGYRQRYGQPPLTEYRATISGMPKDLKEPDIVKIVNSGIVPRLDDLNLARDYNASQLQKHYRTNTEVPYTYIKDIDFLTMAKFAEHDVGLPGVDLAIKPVRSYVYGALAAHLLGYVGPPDDTNKEEAKKFTFYQGDVEGKANIEKIFDQYLRGKPGIRYLRRNAKGVIDGVLKEDSPQQGANVYLTIDARIQAIAEEALRAVSRAGAVVADPNNGNILATVSVPSFDPNKFIPSIKAKDWEALRKDPAHPLVNRAISGLPPGSTFKLITALAGLRKGLTNNKYNCGGGISYGDHFFQCWVASKHYTHGTIGLSDAIKVSCDSFFYQYGNAASIQSINTVGKMLGIGEESGLQLSGEQSGNMPGPEWMQIHHPQERWTQAQTANVSIGQGYTLVSPLQLAMSYVAVANGGTCYYPRLIDKVLDQDGTPVVDEQGKPVSFAPRLRSDLRREVTPEQIELVRRGLWKVVNEDGGTGGRARLKNVQVAGKTGTAQATDRGQEENVAWFVSFAPYDNPKYVVAVMVQGASGHGGEVAAPIATRILERIVEMDEGNFDMQVAWVAPAHHDNPFELIKSVAFKDSNVGGGEDEEDAGTSSADVQMASGGGEPDVEQAPDAEGRVAPRQTRVARAQSVTTPPPERRGFFQRLFGRRSTPAPAPTPTPSRRSRGF